MSKYNLKKAHFATLCVHGSGGVDETTGALSIPIYQSSTFAFKDAKHGADIFSGVQEGYVYTRIGNPTQAALEKEMAFLEGGEAARNGLVVVHQDRLGVRGARQVKTVHGGIEIGLVVGHLLNDLRVAIEPYNSRLIAACHQRNKQLGSLFCDVQPRRRSILQWVRWSIH